MSVYRQKNFFDRWKKKSQRNQDLNHGTLSSGRPYIKSPVPDTYRTTKPNISNADVKYSHFNTRKEMQVRGKTEQIYEPMHHSFSNKDFAVMTPNKLWSGSTDSNKGEGNTSHTSDTGALLKDTTVQTDDFLIESLCFGLRKRMLQNTSIKSKDVHQFHSDLSPSHCEESNAGFECGECEYLFAEDATQSIKTCRDQLDEEEDNDPTTNSNILNTGENLPLLGNAQTRGYHINCDSTSEESLSDHNENFDELDELLAEVCPHKGSFGSVHQQSFANGNNKSREHLHLSCIISDPPVDNPRETGINNENSEFSDNYAPNTFDLRHHRNNLRDTSSDPILLPMQLPDDHFIDQNKFLDSHCGTNQLHQHGSVASSGSSINSSSMISSAIKSDTLHNLGVGSERCSSSDTSENTLKTQQFDNAAPEMPSERDSIRETNKSKFQEFLQTRGVDLDPTAIQHSDF